MPIYLNNTWVDVTRGKLLFVCGSFVSLIRTRLLLLVLLPSLLAVQSPQPTGVRCSCKGASSCLTQVII